MNTPPGSRPARPRRFPNADRRVRERRALYVGLVLSVAVHMVVIAVVSGWLEPQVLHRPKPRAAPVDEVERGMRAVALSESPVPEAAAQSADSRPVRPPDQVTPAAPAAPDPERRREPETEVVDRAHTRTAAERLAPRVVDPRLWRPMLVLPPEPTLRDVQDRIGAAMNMWSDSALAEAERAVRARDWTVEDADGGRWGISPGGLHLGSITLPLPIYFPVDMEQEARNRYWQELELQLDRAAFLENFDARVKAIRERRERERAEGRTPSGGR